jgi:Fe-S-cluster-containing hydrogenase component 2
MMHAITVDESRCIGLDICHACEGVHRGIRDHCRNHGRLLVSWPNTATHSQTITRLINACPNRAITIMPLEHTSQSVSSK